MKEDPSWKLLAPQLWNNPTAVQEMCIEGLCGVLRGLHPGQLGPSHRSCSDKRGSGPGCPYLGIDHGTEIVSVEEGLLVNMTRPFSLLLECDQ